MSESVYLLLDELPAGFLIFLILLPFCVCGSFHAVSEIVRFLRRRNTLQINAPSGTARNR